MAIQAAAYKNFNIRKQASEALAQQLASQQKKESGFGTFLSIAAPLAASFLLPGIGTALVGGLGGMGGMGAGLASAFGGGAFGGGAMGTMLGGLLSGGAKAAGTYAIGEGLEGIGRNQGYGADVDEIDLSKFGRRGVKGEKLGKENLQGSLDAMEEGQRKSALMAGLTTGVDQMGGFDKIKEMSADFGKRVGAGQMPWTSDAEFMEKMGNLSESDLVSAGEGFTEGSMTIKPNKLANIQRITGYDDYVDPMDDFFGGETLSSGLPSVQLGGESIPGSINQILHDMTQEELEELLALVGG